MSENSSFQTGKNIDETLYVLSRQFGRTVVFLDRFGGDRLTDAMAALNSPPAKCLSLDTALFKDDLGKAPLLVELLHGEPSHHLFLAHSIALAREEAQSINGARFVCGWLFTDVTLERLQFALRERLDVHFPKGEQIYLRYFDPRVLPRLVALLCPPAGTAKPAQCNVGQLMGPVRTWCQLTHGGHILRHDNPRLSTAKVSNGHLRFDEAAAAAIDRIETVNRCLSALEQRNVLYEPGDGAEIDSCVVAAQELGLSDKDDQVAYVWRSVSYGTAFTLHPMLHEYASAAAHHGLPFNALLEEHFPSPRAEETANDDAIDE